VSRGFRRWRLPSAEEVQSYRSLRWLGPLLRRPWLWHFDRRSVAAGAAIGVFFGFMIPVLQIACAALAALVLRANLPVAAVATLVSNPFTYAPIGVLAYRTGAALLGEPVAPAEAAAIERSGDDVPLPAESWRARIAALGKPIVVGLAVFAAAGALLAWLGVNLVWLFAQGARRDRAPPGDAERR
jgi:uncharacterized protein (DUF2062 family)